MYMSYLIYDTCSKIIKIISLDIAQWVHHFKQILNKDAGWCKYTFGGGFSKASLSQELFSKHTQKVNMDLCKDISTEN